MAMTDRQIREFVKERNKALFSFDKQKIMEYAKKYKVPIPESDTVFWAAVCKAICSITDAPKAARKRAVEWLRKNNFREDR